jgi:hypothetical protein
MIERWIGCRGLFPAAVAALGALPGEEPLNQEGRRDMFGMRFIKVEPTDFVLQYKRGKVVREGAGLSFFYFAPTTSLVRIPMGSVDVPFIFAEVTADFQSVTVQGQLTFRHWPALAGNRGSWLLLPSRDWRKVRTRLDN